MGPKKSKRSTSPVWSFLVSWESSGWRLSWFALTVLCGVLLGGAVAHAAVGLYGEAVMTCTVVAGVALMAALAARLHRRCNGESVLESYKFWKKETGR